MRRWLFVVSLALVLLPACPKRVVVVGGQKVPYDEASAAAFSSVMEKVDRVPPDQAIAALHAFLRTWPEAKETEPALFHLARLQRQTGDEAGARKSLQRLLEAHPFSELRPTAQLWLGELYLSAGAYNDALQVLRPAFEDLTGEGRRRAAQALVDASIGLQAWQEAIGWLSRLRDLAADPQARETIDGMLLDLVDTKLPPLGIAQLASSLSADAPARPLVMMKLALLQIHLRDYQAAYEVLTRYLHDYPQGDEAGRARALAERIERLAKVEPLTVGVLLPLSGKYQPFGEAVLRGIGMALDLDQGGTARKSPIRLVLKDTKGDPAEAARALEALVLEEHAIAVMGPLLQSTSLAAAEKAEALGVPLVALSRAGGLTELGGWIFRNAVTDEAQARALVAYAAERLGAKRFAILWPDKPYGRSLANAFWDEVDARGLEVRAAETYEHDQKDFQVPIKKMVGRYFLKYRPEYEKEHDRIDWQIKDEYKKRKAFEALRDGLEPIADFDVLFIPDSYKAVGLIAPALAAQDVITNVCDEKDLERIRKTTGKTKLPLVRLLGTNAWNNAALLERGGKYVHCSIFVDGFFAQSQRKETRDFVDAFHKTYGEGKTPGYLESHGYDTARIVQLVIEAQKPATRAAFRAALLKVRAFPGASGDIDVKATGEFEKNLFFLTADRDGIHEIEEAGAAGP